MSEWVSNHEKAVVTKYGTTAPLLRVSKEYNLDYGDVLLYADAFCDRHYDNGVHTAAAFKRIYDQLPINVRTQLSIDMHAIMKNISTYNRKGVETYT